MVFNWDKIRYPFGRNVRKWLAIMFVVIIILSWYNFSGLNFQAVLWRVLGLTIRWKHLFTVFGVMLIDWFRHMLKGGW